MKPSTAIPVLVVTLGGFFLVTVLITMLTGNRPSYAYLVPAPDSIVWEKGDETNLWLNTNRPDVEMRIAQVDLGIGAVRQVFQETGTTMELGRGEGCLKWAVTDLEVYSIIDSNTPRGKKLSIQGNVDRGGQSGALTVHMRIYPLGADPDEFLAPAGDVIHEKGSAFDFIVAAGEDNFAGDDRRYRVPATSGVWIVEASHSDRYPVTAKALTTGDISEFSTTWIPAKAEAEVFLIPQDVGVALIACAVENAVLITLHGEEGEELNRYRVDIHADPIDLLIPTVLSTDIVRTDIRVCVDSADHRANYLDGWEYVGTPVNFGLPGITPSLPIIADVGGNEYAYLFAATVLTSGGVQLLVSPAGASNTSGLDSDRVYPLQLTATLAGGTREETFGVWLDITTQSPGDDGRC